MKPRHAFVTGATGFLGGRLVERLCADGGQVTALRRASSTLGPLADLPITWVEADLTDAEALGAVMPPDLDVVFHVAADTAHERRHDERQNRTNIEGTRAICAAALDRGARRLVHTSSVAAFGLHAVRFDESVGSTALDTPINYFHSKFHAERAVDEAIDRGLDAVVLNPANIVGPGDQQGWIRVFGLVARGELPGVGPGTATWCHVDDVVAAHLAAVSRGERGERFLLGGPEATFLEFAQAIAAEVGGKAPAKALPAWLLRIMGHLKPPVDRLLGREVDLTPELALLVSSDIRCDSSRAVEVLDYRITPLGEIVRDTAEWMRSEGLLPAG